MKYLIIGVGGTGGCLGVHMARGGLDVTLIARGQHLAALQNNGLTLVPSGGEAYTVPVQATDSDHYQGQPDVVFLCVKGYSLDALIPFLQRICTKDTVVIPILNIYGTGGRLQPSLPESLVTDGCIYVAASIQSPGVVAMQGEILRVVFGPRTPEEYRPVLKDIQADLLILDALSPDASTSMQRDLWAGHESEVDGLIFEVVRLGQRYQVPTPTYCMVARKLGYDC